jgi:hypothetical protein
MTFKYLSTALVLAASLAMFGAASAANYPDCPPYYPHSLIYDSNWWRPDYAPNWGPFFARHVYRYGPLACGTTVATTTSSTVVIKSKY